jgi:1,4-alpha-glucan branching enzyme
VILDWVPGHFPNDWHGLMRFDGTALYEHADPRQGQHPDWGTLIFNYGRNEVRGFLLANACYWIDRYHVDGLRVDGVASMLYLDYSRQPGEWIPNRYGGRENLEAIGFLREFNTLIHQRPGVFTAAEESTAWPGVTRPAHLDGLGFTFKWNMGWMHDLLTYMGNDPIYRKYHHNLLTFVMLYAFHENFILPLSHDEVVHGKASLQHKMPGNEWQRFANLRLLYGYMYGQPGKNLLFMGAEFGQSQEWSYDRPLEWWLLEFDPHRKLRRYIQALNYLYRSEPALYQVDFDPAGFEWIDFRDWEQSVVCFLRRAKDPADFVVFACNFTPEPRSGYRVGVPEGGYYREVLNSDSEHFGGSNLGNGGGVEAELIPWHGRPYSLLLTLPPLAVTVFKKQR